MMTSDPILMKSGDLFRRVDILLESSMAINQARETQRRPVRDGDETRLVRRIQW